MLDINNTPTYTKKNIHGGFLFKSKKTKKARSFVELFISFIFKYGDNYNDNTFIIPENIKNFLQNVKSFKKIYIKKINLNKRNRLYRRLPLPSIIDKIFNLNSDETTSYNKICDSIYEYICIMTLFENILYNIAVNYNSSNFTLYNDDDKDLINIGLDKLNLAKDYLSDSHNKVFSKLYKMTINLSKLEGKDKNIFKSPSSAVKNINDKDVAIDTLPTQNIQTPNTLLHELFKKQINTDVDTIKFLNIEKENTALQSEIKESFPTPITTEAKEPESNSTKTENESVSNEKIYLNMINDSDLVIPENKKRKQQMQKFYSTKRTDF